MDNLIVFYVVLAIVFAIIGIIITMLYSYHKIGYLTLTAIQKNPVDRTDLEALLVSLLIMQEEIHRRGDSYLEPRTAYLLQLHVNQFLSVNRISSSVILWWRSKALGISYRKTPYKVYFEYRGVVVTVDAATSSSTAIVL